MSVRFRFAGRSGSPGTALSLKSGYDEDCVRDPDINYNPSLLSTARPSRLLRPGSVKKKSRDVQQ